MKICPIASSSSGNCIYVGTENTHILVDAGISKKRIEEGLGQIGLKGSDIQGIVLTHEHRDHICGLGVFLRKYPVRLYGTLGTLKGVSRESSLGSLPLQMFTEIQRDNEFTIGDIGVKPIGTSHDAADSVGYIFKSRDKKIAVVTDLGTYNDYISDSLKGLDLIMLESNHDVRMLEAGPYPYNLKRRILSDEGHLSNEMAGRLLRYVADDRLKVAILAHLSDENNMPELAYETVRLELCDKAEKIKLVVAKKTEPTGLWEV